MADNIVAPYRVERYDGTLRTLRRKPLGKGDVNAFSVVDVGVDTSDVVFSFGGAVHGSSGGYGGMLQNLIITTTKGTLAAYLALVGDKTFVVTMPGRIVSFDIDCTAAVYFDGTTGSYGDNNYGFVIDAAAVGALPLDSSPVVAHIALNLHDYDVKTYEFKEPWYPIDFTTGGSDNAGTMPLFLSSINLNLADINIDGLMFAPLNINLDAGNGTFFILHKNKA